jgi:hypothetical protein
MAANTHPHPAVRRTERAAWLLDECIRIPLTDRRFGLDPLIGLLPYVGGAVTLLFSLYIVVEALVAGVPRRTIALMLVNVGLDAAIGFVPIVGDLFDATWKANVRNKALLERALSE